jgi:hypothetical protein
MVNEKQNERKENIEFNTLNNESNLLKIVGGAILVGTTFLSGCKSPRIKYNPNWAKETTVEFHNYDPYACHQRNGYTIHIGSLFKSGD